MLLRKRGSPPEPLAFADAKGDGAFPIARKPGGVLQRRADLKSLGVPYGTLCHYDIRRCETRTSDIPLLKATAPLIYEALGRAS